MSKYAYDEIVIVREGIASGVPSGTKGWVIAVFADTASRPGTAFDHFPDGAVYTLELEDGSTAELHESWLEPART